LCVKFENKKERDGTDVQLLLQDLQFCCSEGFCATDGVTTGRKFGVKCDFIYVFGAHN